MSLPGNRKVFTLRNLKGFTLRNRKGFTLLELMMTLSIFGLIMTFMFQLLNVNIRLVKSEDTRAEHAENTRTAANYIMKRIREYNSVNIIYDSVTREIKADGTVILNAAGSSSNPGNARLWYSRTAGSEYGELKDISGTTLASYIRYLDVDDSNSAYLRLKIATGSDGPSNNPLYLCVPLKGETSPGSPAIKIMEFNQNYASPNENVIKPMIKLVNTGTGPLNLTDVKIRYYYTINGDKEQTFQCFWSSVNGGSSNVTGTFVKMAEPVSGADYYLEIGFSAGAGMLEPGNAVDMHTMISNSAYYIPYFQEEDYSFNPTASDYVDWTKVTGYINSALRWGAEPSGPAPSNQSFRIQMYNINREDSTSSIAPWFRIINDGDVYLNLPDLKIKYYFTIDSNTTMNFACDWADQYFIGGNTNVTASFVKMPTAGIRADYYLEIGFKSTAGRLPPGMSADIQARIWKNGYTTNTQINDYSFNPDSTAYTDWTRVTGHLLDTLKWGTPPSPLPPDAVAYYDFTDTTYDLTTNNNDGGAEPIDGNDTVELILAPGHDGEPNSAAYFDGTYYVEAPASTSLRSIEDELTINLWCYPTGYDDKMGIVDWTKGDHGFELYINSDGKAVFATKDAAIISNIIIPINKWTHLKATYKAGTENGIRIYINDIIDSQGNTSGTYISDDPNGLVLGAERSGNSDNMANGFIGYLDDILIQSSVDY